MKNRSEAASWTPTSPSMTRAAPLSTRDGSWVTRRNPGARSRNAIPLLVGYIGRAMVGDHRSPRLRHAAENVEAGTEGTRDLAVGLGIPTLVVRIGLTGQEDHWGVIRCVTDAQQSPGKATLSI